MNPSAAPLDPITIGGLSVRYLIDGTASKAWACSS